MHTKESSRVFTYRGKAKLRPIADKLHELAADNQLTPERVVEDARNPRSVLHEHFTWDNGEAAERWRIQEARMLIATVQVTFIDGAGEDRETRAFVSVNEITDQGKRRHYMPTENALGRYDLRQQLLERALRDLETFQAKYNTLVELADIFAALEKTKAKVRRRTSKPKRRSLAAAR